MEEEGRQEMELPAHCAEQARNVLQQDITVKDSFLEAKTRESKLFVWRGGVSPGNAW